MSSPSEPRDSFFLAFVNVQLGRMMLKFASLGYSIYTTSACNCIAIGTHTPLKGTAVPGRGFLDTCITVPGRHGRTCEHTTSATLESHPREIKRCCWPPQGEKVEIFAGYRGITKKKPLFLVVRLRAMQGPL